MRRTRNKTSERNKVTDLGENINDPLHLQPRNLGRDAPRPKLLKRRGGKSQEEAQAVHKSDPTGRAAGNQALQVSGISNQGSDEGTERLPCFLKATALRRAALGEGCFRRWQRRGASSVRSGPGGETVRRAYSACVTCCINSSLILNFIFLR